MSSNCKEFAHDFWIGAIGLSPNFDKVCELRLCAVREPFVRTASFCTFVAELLVSVQRPPHGMTSPDKWTWQSWQGWKDNDSLDFFFGRADGNGMGSSQSVRFCKLTWGRASTLRPEMVRPLQSHTKHWTVTVQLQMLQKDSAQAVLSILVQCRSQTIATW